MSLSGVKRSAPVGSVPGDFPGAPGFPLGPTEPLKVLKLDPSRKPNQQSNVALVYTRTVDEASISIASGRLGPGDVLFVRRDLPSVQNHTNTVESVLGLDAYNDLLMGRNGHALRAGYNVLIDGSLDDVLPKRRSNGRCGFGLGALDEYALDSAASTTPTCVSTQSYKVPQSCPTDSPSTVPTLSHDRRQTNRWGTQP